MRPEASDQDSQPLVVTSSSEARLWTRSSLSRQRRVALVPTMGALHRGHLELVRRAKGLADDVVVSLFVNPTQFGPSEDFARYPRTLQEDIAKLHAEGVAMIFAPTVGDMYGDRFSTTLNPPQVALPLEGEFRTSHFSGVCTVVLKLFQIIPAQVAVFGQKDYQQSRVIIDMVADLNVDVVIDVMPTVRDPDGLALSSRNRYLSAADRTRALSLSRALDRVEALYRSGQCEVSVLQDEMRHILDEASVDAVDYAVIVDPQTLLPLSHVLSPVTFQSSPKPTRPTTDDAVAVALIAAHVSGTRLIDNRLLFKSRR